ncbi:unnamed protein product [Rotaria sp. Silwood2]|nr:unnamed protein product [Rotaria sp. Silwood2]CAF3082493.1 unnamed protein product [Rotaria sp. Silwood2]CAF3228113.1 unnamed protein product [Rotaria sp. Silwood2]CAF4218170.1 unnamed protein product [Rotaria sp. Silwood2]CAF4269508.1 unnamed protein product [Rotaria sp. Silwood2]
MFGNGNGSFQEEIEVHFNDSSTPYNVAVSDFNNDNLSDIAITVKDYDNIVILLGNGDGTFKEHMTFSIDNDNNSMGPMVVNDFNSDGLMDIVVATNDADNLYVLLGNGNGTFGTQITYSTGHLNVPSWVADGDFNTDDLLDIVMVHRDLDNIDVFLGNGDGTFQVPRTLSTGDMTEPISIAVGDFDNDSLLDITFGMSMGKGVGVMLGNGDSTFKQPLLFVIEPGSALSQVIVSDFNNDHRLDIGFIDSMRSSVGVLIGNGDGTFKDEIISFTIVNHSPTWISVGDFNNDGLSDIVFSKQSINSIGILLNAC